MDPVKQFLAACGQAPIRARGRVRSAQGRRRGYLRETLESQREGYRLQQARKEAGYSRSALALLVGVRRNCIANVEAGRLPGDPAILERIRAALAGQKGDQACTGA